MKNLTPPQKQVLEFIKAQEIVPTQQEIAQHLGITQQGAYYHVNQLVKKGWLIKDQRAHRGLYIA